MLLGGARSGKSFLAQQLAQDSEQAVCLIVTAERLDEDMINRIDKHRAERPSTWRVTEEPLRISEAARTATDGFLIVDCITVWLGNALHYGWSETQIFEEVNRFIEILVLRESRSVVVSNEVGLGIHPVSTLSREYRDLLGKINALLAKSAEQSYFMVAGQVLALVNPALLRTEKS